MQIYINYFSIWFKKYLTEQKILVVNDFSFEVMFWKTLFCLLFSVSCILSVEADFLGGITNAIYAFKRKMLQPWRFVFNLEKEKSYFNEKGRILVFGKVSIDPVNIKAKDFGIYYYYFHV